VQDLCDRILDLLGKSHQDESFRKFLKELGERPQRASTCHVFPLSGFMLISLQEKFVSTSFRIACEMSGSGVGEGFIGTLPCGIDPTDRRADIAKKLNVGRLSSKIIPGQEKNQSGCYLDDYPYMSFVITVSFNATTDQMNGFAVTLKDEVLSVVAPFYEQSPMVRARQLKRANRPRLRR